MILNSFALLAAFLALLRLLGGLVIISTVARSWPGRPHGGRDLVTERFYLLPLLAVAVIGLNVISWPLLYLLLQSYVAQFPGVMCIYGVTRVGTGSAGPARHLPALLTFLQVAKPALVFAGGAWFSLYALNRKCNTAPLIRRLLILLGPVGLLTIADAAAELAYLGIPKAEHIPTSGCCVADESDADRYEPKAVSSEAARGWLTGAFYGGSATLVLCIWAAARRPRGVGPGALGLLFAAAGGLSAVASVYAIDVAAPELLGLPDHHCVYDLFPRVPEAVVAATLFTCGGFSLGWAWVVAQLGRNSEAASHLPAAEHVLLRLALWCYLVSVPMLAIELALA